MYINAAGGSIDQLLEHRAFSKDKFDSIASVSVSYWLLEPEGGTILAAGSAQGTVRLQGAIGGTITTGPVQDQAL